MSASRVAVTIVTFNSARYIAGCLEHVFAQTHKPIAICVVDNASSDSTIEILHTFEIRDSVRIAYNRQNLGFAAAQNQAMAAIPDADWVLTLNPDVQAHAKLRDRASLGERTGARHWQRVRETSFVLSRFRACLSSAARFNRHLLHAELTASGPREPHT